jgi:type IV pilus assembly protein PilM
MNTKRSLFYKFFPVPEFMEMHATGIDLSEVSLRFVGLVPHGRNLDLGGYGEYPVPPGTISLGRIQNADSLRELLRKVKKEQHLKFVRLSLPESYVYHVEMEIAKVKKNEIRESIELQLEEHVPLKASEVFFDYDIAETPKQRPGVLVVVVSAIPKEIVLSYVEVFESAGLAVVSVEVDASALARAVVPRKDLGTFMIVDMGRVKTGVYVVQGGFVRFASDIEVGGKLVAASIQKNAGVSPEEAEKLKKACYIDQVSEVEISEEVQKSLQDVFSSVLEEINKYFIYWHTHRDKNDAPREKIEKIILAGTESTLIGFQDYLAGGLHVPVEMGNIWTNMFSFDDRIPKIGYHDSLRYGTAIGLALASEYN